MSNKEKLIASAQKNLQKGQIARAVKDYQKLVEIDPRDMRTRKKLAELYSRSGMTEEALGEYRKVAKDFGEKGFFSKAIAVYKQMQKLDPGKIEIYHHLAELNEKQGLVGNALLEYRNLLTHYEKQQMFSESIEILGKMKELDPENLNIRVKITECYARGGLKEKAKEEFQSVLEQLEEQGDFGRIHKLYEIFLPFFPEDPQLMAGLAKVLIHQSEADKGIHLLKNLLKDHPEDSTILETLAWGYGEAGDHENERLAYHHLLKNRPDNLDLREGFLRACLAGTESRRALDALLEWKEDFLEAGRDALVKTWYQRLRQDLPKNDPDLKAMGAFLADTKEKGPAIPSELDLEVETPSAAPAGGKEGEKAGNLQPAESPPLEGAIGDGDAMEEIPLEFLEKVDLSGEETSEKKTSETDEALLEELEVELELDLEPGSAEEIPGEGTAEKISGESAAPLEAEPAAAEDTEEILDLGEILSDEEPAAASSAEPPPDLEEAEFYLQQGLLDEAEGICRRLMDLDPSNADAGRKLKEIEERREELSQAAETPGGPLEDLTAEALEGGLLGDATEESGSFNLDGLFSDSQQGIKTEIEVDDAESHYNLGIAYKEMGLLDEAMQEFDQAARNADRRVACLILKGICLVEKGSFDVAEEVFKEGLGLPDLSAGERISLNYEMGLLYEAWGRPLEALECFQFVADADLFFRNVGEKTRALRQQLGLEGDGKNGAETPKGKKDRISFV